MITIYVLGSILFLLILLFAWMIYRLNELYQENKDSMRPQPYKLRFILDEMLRTIEAQGSWDQLEFMRVEVRGVLRTLDIVRHDLNNKRLRASKQKCQEATVY